MLPVQWHRISERIDFWVTAVGPIRPKLSLLEPVVWRLKRHERWTALYPHIHVPDSLSRCVWPTTNAGHSPVKSVNRRQTWLYSYYIRQGLECSHCYHLPLHIPYVEINIRGGKRRQEFVCLSVWEGERQRSSVLLSEIAIINVKHRQVIDDSLAQLAPIGPALINSHFIIYTLSWPWLCRWGAVSSLSTH